MEGKQKEMSKCKGDWEALNCDGNVFMGDWRELESNVALKGDGKTMKTVGRRWRTLYSVKNS